MKKVCVTTYCQYNSYGSVLQALGLQNAVSSLGAESFIVKDEKQRLLQLQDVYSKSKGIKSSVLNLHKFLIRKKLLKLYRSVDEFIQENIRVKYYDDYEKLSANVPEADVYLSGSDQIWNPLKIMPLFFLDFVPKNARKVSYAASMGVLNICEDKVKKFSEYIKKYDSLSVREKDCKEVVSRFTQKEVEVNIDPVFLMDREKWRKYEQPYKIKKPYILVYPIFWDKSLNKKLRKLHKETGKDIVVISLGYRRIYSNKKIYDASLQQFLWLVDNADAVVSSSFHGVAMSIVFNKKFSAVINPSSPSRLNSLLDTLEIKNCPIDELLSVDFDYDKINENIKNERRKSENYLRKALMIDD